MIRPARTIPRLSFLSSFAVWPACYTLAVYLLGVLTLGLPSPRWSTTVYLLLVAHACYLLDRVKLSDQRQDPADAIALPDRAILFAEHSGVIRTLLLLEFIAASAFGWFISPALSLIPMGALLGVHLYAGRAASPGRPRFKDLPALKSFFISSAHIALVVAVLWGNDHNLIEHPRPIVMMSILGLWLIVSGDAILCDLDDHDSDAMYGTRSLPVLIGNTNAWIIAQLLLMIGCIVMVTPSPELFVWPVLVAGIFLSTLPTLIMKNRRDLVDARLLPFALIALLLR